MNSETIELYAVSQISFENAGKENVNICFLNKKTGRYDSFSLREIVNIEILEILK